MKTTHSRRGVFSKVGENLYRYSSNGVYYARYRNKGKDIQYSLKTTDREFAKRLLKGEMSKINKVDLALGKMTLEELLRLYDEGLKQIEMVLNEYQFDVIHFNNGMHGWQHGEAEYAQALPKLLTTIQKRAPNAKLVWANTTPLKVSPTLPSGNQTQATDERIAARNAIALKVMQAKGIPVDDLNAPMLGHPEYHSDNVHFNDQGIAIQAAQVAAHVEKLLKP